MPSDAREPISDLIKIFSSLNKMREEPKGVNAFRTVIKDGEDDIDPSLSSSETARLKNIATILGKVWQIGEFAPKPEAQKLSDLTPADRKPSTVDELRDRIIKKQPRELPKEGKPGSITRSLDLLGLSEIKQFVDKVEGVLGTAIKTIAVVRSILPRNLGGVKSIKDRTKVDVVIPTLSSSETARLKNIATVMGKVWQLGEFAPKPEAERLSDLTPDKKKTSLLGNIGDKIKDRQLTKIPSEDKSGLLDNLLNLLGLKGLKNILSSLTKGLTALKVVVISLLNKSKAFAKPIVDKAKAFAKPIVDKAKAFAKPIVDKAKALARPFINKAKSRAKAATIVETAKALKQSVVSGVKVAAEKTKSATIKTAQDAVKVAKNIKNLTLSQAKTIGKNYIKDAFKGGPRTLGKKLLSKIPIIGSLIETGFAAKDISDYKKEYKTGKITADELNQKAGARVVKAITSIAGTAIGAAALSFIPGLGTFIGAVGGNVLGNYLGDIIVENVLSPDITKKLGAWATMTKATDTPVTANMKSNVEPKLQVGELQDYIIQNGSIIPFSDKDKLLSMKKDGAFDNLFKSNTDNTVKLDTMAYNKFAKSALVEQIKRQDKMIDLLVAMTRKSFGNTTIQQPQTQPSYNHISENFRNEFNSQTLATNY